MKIWIIGRSYPDNKNNMMGSFEIEQAKMLRRHFKEVHYICAQIKYKQPIKNRGYNTWEEDGVIIHSLSNIFTPRICQLYLPIIRNYYWKKLLKRVYEEAGSPDLIHIHYPAMLMIADQLKGYHDKGVRIFATEHWTKVLSKKLEKKELEELKKYGSLSDQFICVGSPLRESVKELIGLDAAVIPNIFNSLFQPSTDKHEGFRFVAVGRLEKIKQFDKIIEAFSECFKGQKDITLTIVGGGVEKESLKTIISEWNIEEQVHLAGSQSREKTAEIVANSDSLICYSRLETFGVPIIEAWACGLTAITTTAASVIDNFDKRLGVEVPYDDFEALKKSLRYIYENKEKFDKNFIAQYARKNFSEDAVFRRLVLLYGLENVLC